jgi:hypothetical protein
MVVMKDDAELDTYAISGDETMVKSRYSAKSWGYAIRNVQKMIDTFQIALSGIQLIQRYYFCDKRRRPMRLGAKGWNHQWRREVNGSVQDMDWMRRGWVSLQAQYLFHQNNKSTKSL